MKTVYLFLFLSFVTIAGMASAQSEFAERAKHYDAKKPTTAQESVALLLTSVHEIGNVLQKAELDNNDLEKVHQISYQLEAAVDGIRKHGKTMPAAKIDTIDEAIQAIHYASENHEAEKTREWYGELVTALEVLSNAS